MCGIVAFLSKHRPANRALALLQLFRALPARRCVIARLQQHIDLELHADAARRLALLRHRAVVAAVEHVVYARRRRRLFLFSRRFGPSDGERVVVRIVAFRSCSLLSVTRGLLHDAHDLGTDAALGRDALPVEISLLPVALSLLHITRSL